MTATRSIFDREPAAQGKEACGMCAGCGAWIIVATYDERENVTKMVPALRAAANEADILVVDDSSPDGTGALVLEFGKSDAKVHLLARGAKQGYGTAILAGLRHALQQGARKVITLDADFSHDPQDVPAMLAMLDEQADVVIGSRYKDGIRILNWSLSRLALSVWANFYVRSVLGIGIQDSTSGYRGYRREAVEALLERPPQSTGYSFLVECLYALLRQGFRVAEHPVVYHERRVGQSKMSSSVIREAAWRPVQLRLLSLFSRRGRKWR